MPKDKPETRTRTKNALSGAMLGSIVSKVPRGNSPKRGGKPKQDKVKLRVY